MTAPTSLPPSCTLWVNGARFADGATPGETDQTPVALTDLRVVWGRDNTLDQPGPATLSCRVLDVGPSDRFVTRLAVGARVEVRADAVIYPDPSVSTFLDPSFEAGAVGSTPSSIRTNARTVTVTNSRAFAGAQSVRVDPADASRRVRVIFPPAPFSASQDPAAWDAIPRTLAGTTWEFGAATSTMWSIGSVVPVVQVRPVLFRQPWPGTETVIDVLADRGPPSGDRWRVHAGRFVPAPDRWVGIAVDLFPTGPQWDQVNPGITWDTFAAGAAGPSWQDLAAVFVDAVTVLAPAAGAARSGAVFSGRITDMEAYFDEGIGGTIVEVTGQDDTAELGNRFVGDQPWLAEPLSTRFARVVAGAGQPGLTGTVDPSVAAPVVTWRDVDSQPALSLLQELAASVGGVLWSATSLTTGPYLRLEDINARPALQTLERGADLVVRIVPSPAAATDAIEISACDVDLEPVRWRQDATDDSTRVTATWFDQTLDNDGNPQPSTRSVLSVDPARETATGRREVSIGTQLTTAPAAQAVADAVLARLIAGGWRISGLSWDAAGTDRLDASTIGRMMQILDGTTRLGLGVMLTDLPDWSPVPAGQSVPMYLEGSTLTNTDGAWTLDLVVSSAAGQGTSRAPWSSLPAPWSWQQFDPSVTWASLRGVGAPA